MDNLDVLMNEVKKAVELEKELKEIQKQKLIDEINYLYENIIEKGIIDEVRMLLKLMDTTSNNTYKVGTYRLDRKFEFSGKNMVIFIYKEDIEVSSARQCFVFKYWENYSFTDYYSFEKYHLVQFSNEMLSNILTSLNDFLDGYNNFKEKMINNIVILLNDLNIKNEQLLKQLDLMKTRVTTITITEEEMLTHQLKFDEFLTINIKIGEEQNEQFTSYRTQRS